MQRVILGSVAVAFVLSQAVTFSQGSNGVAMVVSADEIEKVVNAPGGGDREVKIFDMGRFNLGVAVLNRGATKPGAPVGAINHTKVTEAYYVVSGSGTLVTGGEVVDIKAIPPTSELYTTVVGPGNQGTFKTPAKSQKIGPGDVVIIPAGVYHGFSEVPDHIKYVSVRPDPDKALPGGYVNPALK
jgi:mannose-6-phosphate isomerase-like protein (cupin superfamily)